MVAMGFEATIIIILLVAGQQSAQDNLVWI